MSKPYIKLFAALVLCFFSLQLKAQNVTISGTSCTPDQAGVNTEPLDDNYYYQGNLQGQDGSLNGFAGLTNVWKAWMNSNGINAIVSDDQGNFVVCHANNGTIYYTATGTANGNVPCNGWVEGPDLYCNEPNIVISGDCENIVTAEPEINLNYIIDLPSASDIPVTTSTGVTPIELIVSIENTGDAMLNLTGTPAVAVSGASNVTIKTQPATTISAGSSTTFTIELDPGCNAGQILSSLSILNNDSDEGIYALSVSGTVNGSSIAYGSTAYCMNDTDPTPTISGVTGGVFSSTSGLSISASSGIIDLSASTIGSYTVNYTIGSCVVDSKTVTINGLDDVSFDYAAPQYCVSANNPTPTVGTIGGMFTASPALPISGNDGTIDLSTSTPGTYSITYTSTVKCANASNKSITIKALPLPVVKGNLSYCANDGSTTLEVEGTYDSYTWSTAETTQSIAVSSTNNPITVSVMKDGCVGSLSAPVNVTEIANPLPVVKGNLSYCANNRLTALVVEGTYDRYTWSTTETAQSILVSIADNPITVSVMKDGCVGSLSAPVNVNVRNADTSLVQVGSVLTANATEATYKWLNCADMSVIDGEVNKDFTATMNGSYAVEIKQNDCVDTSRCVPVSNLITESSENTFGAITVYPNPSQGEFILTLATIDTEATVKLYSITGELIVSKNVIGVGQIEIPREYGVGVYFLEVSDLNGTYDLRVIKE